MKRITRVLLVTVLGLFVIGETSAQSPVIDDDFIQHASIDSTVAVTPEIQLWLFLKGPADLEFNTISQIFQKQYFVITIADSSYFNNDTLYFHPDFGMASSATEVGIAWTNTYDDNGDILSGAISGVIMKLRISTSPADSVTLGSWDTDLTVMDRHVTDPTDSAWAATLGPGGLMDAVTITSLDSTKDYWFAARAVDDAWNWSGVSNNVFVDLNTRLDSTTTQIYALTTSFNKWDPDLQEWTSGPIGPIIQVEVTLGVLPQGEAIQIIPGN